VLRAHLGEGRVERELMARFLAVGLVALEVMNGGADRLPRPLVRTDGMDLMAHGEEGLKRDHDLVVFHKVADKYEDLFRRHDGLLSGCMRSWPYTGPQSRLPTSSLQKH